MDRRVLQVGALVWAAVGGAIALAALGEVNGDARLVVGAASVLGPLAAVAASRSVGRTAGALLVVSALLTPTYVAYVFNLVPLVAGLALLMAPRRVVA